MDFSEFKNTILAGLREHLPKGFQEASIQLGESRKINETYDSLTVMKEGQHIAPSVNLNLFYMDYQAHGDLEKIFDEICQIVQKEPVGMELDAIEDYEKAKENLFIRVSNAKTNEELLSKVPHEIIGDLAITFHIMIGQDEDGFGSTLITNELLEKYPVTEAELKEDAMANSARILSPSIESMNNVMARMMGISEDHPFLGTLPFEEAVKDFSFREDGMYVLTNQNAVNGAAVMFYPTVMEQLAEQAGVDLFIIPSSVHETILLADDGVMNRPELENMIRDINAHEVAPKDRLSDTLYHYDGREHKLERAVDFEERREKEMSRAGKKEKTSVKEKIRSAEEREKKQPKGPDAERDKDL